MLRAVGCFASHRSLLPAEALTTWLDNDELPPLTPGTKRPSHDALSLGSRSVKLFPRLESASDLVRAACSIPSPPFCQFVGLRGAKTRTPQTCIVVPDANPARPVAHCRIVNLARQLLHPRCGVLEGPAGVGRVRGG